MAYGFSQYHRLEVLFSDGLTRSSNIFETNGFNSRYKVTIGAADLLVEPARVSSRLTPIAITLFCLCGVALIIAAIVLMVRFLLRKK